MQSTEDIKSTCTLCCICGRSCLASSCRLVVGCFNVGGVVSIVLTDPKTAICEAVDADQLKKKCRSGDYELLLVKNDMAAPTR